MVYEGYTCGVKRCRFHVADGYLEVSCLCPKCVQIASELHHDRLNMSKLCPECVRTGNKYESFRSVIDILHMGMIYGLYMWVWIVVYESYGGLDIMVSTFIGLMPLISYPIKYPNEIPLYRTPIGNIHKYPA